MADNTDTQERMERMEAEPRELRRLTEVLQCHLDEVAPRPQMATAQSRSDPRSDLRRWHDDHSDTYAMTDYLGATPPALAAGFPAQPG